MLTRLQQLLGTWAKRALAREQPHVVAITGSVGKSSTKMAIAALLQADAPGSKTQVSSKNYNNELGLPLTIFGLGAPGRSIVAWIKTVLIGFATGYGLRATGFSTFVLEMGADKPGDLAYLVDIAKPDVAVVTAVTPEGPSIAPVHTANYPSIDAVAEEKATLVCAVKHGGAVVLNADDQRVFAMRHLTHEHVVTFGETDAADVHLLKVAIRCEAGEHGTVPVGLDVELESLNRHRFFYIPAVFGRSMAYSIAAAVATGVAMDIGVEPVLQLCEHLHPLPGRTRIVPGIKGSTLFDDSYNAAPASVLSGLRDLGSIALQAGQRRAACLGEMRELGEQAEMLHRMVGAEAVKQGVDLLVAVGPFAEAMADGARSQGLSNEKIQVFEDTPEAGRFLQEWIKPGDIVFAKASEGQITSKGVRMERVIKELMAEPLRAGELLCRQEEAWGRR